MRLFSEGSVCASQHTTFPASHLRCAQREHRAQSQCLERSHLAESRANLHPSMAQRSHHDEKSDAGSGCRAHQMMIHKGDMNALKNTRKPRNKHNRLETLCHKDK